MSTDRSDILIIGGGISGLSAAFYLNKQGRRASLVAPHSELGGMVQSVALDGSILEAGPDSFISTKRSAIELAQELGLDNQIIPSNDSRRRVFLVRNQKLVPMPSGMSFMVPVDIEAARQSPLFSAETLRRIDAELHFAPRTRPADFSVRELVEDHFGAELLADIAEPLLAGVYGGDPARLSAPAVLPRFVDLERRYGSLIRGCRAEPLHSPGTLFQSMKEGMGQLTRKLVETVRPSLIDARVASLSRHPNGWQAVLTDGAKLQARHVIVATSAFTAASLLQTDQPALAALLSTIPYSSAILINFLFTASDVEHALDGFGFLVPARERGVTAAATWINTKFPGRLAASAVGIRVFIVEPQSSAIAEYADETIASLAQAELEMVMGIQAKPRHSIVHRWRHSMPQYTVGHAALISRIQQHLDTLPGLALISNYFDGVGVPDCIRLAKTVAGSLS